MKLLLISALMFIAPHMFPVQETISGIVTNEKGNTIMGVVVSIKGTEHKVKTDRQGRFKFENVQIQDERLVFNHPAFFTYELLMDATPTETLKIKLVRDPDKIVIKEINID